LDLPAEDGRRRRLRRDRFAVRIAAGPHHQGRGRKPHRKDGPQAAERAQGSSSAGSPGLVDLERGRLLEVVADRTRAAVAGWLHARPRSWLAQVAMVALDPWRGYASALVGPLGHARVVVDHFHAIRLANTVVDQVRRRT
jgi:hypothetical protein